MSKKVIIVIVEGFSDETLLIERLQSLYLDSEIRFEIQFGDIFYDSVFHIIYPLLFFNLFLRSIILGS